MPEKKQTIIGVEMFCVNTFLRKSALTFLLRTPLRRSTLLKLSAAERENVPACGRAPLTPLMDMRPEALLLGVIGQKASTAENEQTVRASNAGNLRIFLVDILSQRWVECRVHC